MPILSAPLPLLATQRMAEGENPLIKPINDTKPVRIAFGSCNRQTKSQDFWETIQTFSPDAWVSLGDNIYADYYSPQKRLQEYQKLLTDEHYLRFSSEIPCIATWDDHDYAHDNADGRFEGKEESQNVFYHFVGEPLSSKRRLISGVYRSYLLGAEESQVEICLLDLRFFREKPNGSASLLGTEQWQWLEERLAKSPAKLMIIGTSIQFTNPYSGLGLETWSKYREEKTRLLAKIDASPRQTILISGDRHLGELAKDTLPSGRPLFELTSSGLTDQRTIPIKYKARVGSSIIDRNFGILDIEWQGTAPVVYPKLLHPKTGELLQAYPAIAPVTS